MTNDLQRNLGEQPIAAIMVGHGLKAHDLVTASNEHITHKMVARACRGRRVTPNVQSKIRNAINRAAGTDYGMEDLFNY